MTSDSLLCFLLSLQISSIPAAVNQFTGSAGEDFSGYCGSSFPGTRKIFCRENCVEGNVLIETTENSAENGRYSIEYVKGHGANVYSLLVKISALTGSDSGRYRCGLGESSKFYQDFILSVSVTSTSRPSTSQSSSTNSFTPTGSSGAASSSDLTPENTTTTTTTTTDSTSSGSLTPSASSETTNQSSVSHEEEETSDGVEMSAGRLLAVALTGAGILLSAALLVLCRQRCLRLLTGVKTTRGSDRRDQKDNDYENSSSGDLIYMNAKPVCRNKK